MVFVKTVSKIISAQNKISYNIPNHSAASRNGIWNMYDGICIIISNILTKKTKI